MARAFKSVSSTKEKENNKIVNVMIRKQFNIK